MDSLARGEETISTAIGTRGEQCRKYRDLVWPRKRKCCALRHARSVSYEECIDDVGM
jgi:hypothetical protein